MNAKHLSILLAISGCDSRTCPDSQYLGDDGLCYSPDGGGSDLGDVEERLETLEGLVADLQSQVDKDGTSCLSYHFEESTGDLVQDSSGNGLHGDVRDASWTEGFIGQAVEFNGSDGSVETGDIDILDVGEAVTIEAWIYEYGTPSAYRTIVSKWFNTGSAESSYILEIRDDGTLCLGLSGGIADSGPSCPLHSSASVPTDQWVYVVGTYNGSVASLYVNGEVAGTHYTSGIIPSTSSPVLVGANDTTDPTYTNVFEGMIDEVRIYNYALSGNEITDRYLFLSTIFLTGSK